jgi:hypothetical protein
MSEQLVPEGVFDGLMSSQGASPAKTSARPGKSRGSRASGRASGSRCSGLSPSSDLAECSSKTQTGVEGDGCRKPSGVYEGLAIEFADRSLSPRLCAALRTFARDVSCSPAWPTATKAEATRGGQEIRPKRREGGSWEAVGEAAKRWATATVSEAMNNGTPERPKLTNEVALWATAKTQDAHGGYSLERAGPTTYNVTGPSLGDQMRAESRAAGENPSDWVINPDWRDSFMGFPIGWTDCPLLPADGIPGDSLPAKVRTSTSGSRRELSETSGGDETHPSTGPSGGNGTGPKE